WAEARGLRPPPARGPAAGPRARQGGRLRRHCYLARRCARHRAAGPARAFALEGFLGGPAGLLPEAGARVQRRIALVNGTVTLIVSDLHLGAEASLDDFYADEDFADFLRYHAAQHPRLHLVINGDWIDFLQIDPYPEKRARREDLEEVYPLRMTEDQAVAAAERTMLRHPLFFQALREFLAEKPTRRITVLRGNHDIELAFPAVQARLRLELGSPPGDRLAFPPVCYFERETGLYVEHGCQYDPWNAFHRFDDPFL